VRLRVARLIGDRHLPWEVTQSEFQGDSFVLQLRLRESLVDTRSNPQDLFYYQPLQLYRDSVKPVWHRFAGTRTFILSFRDEDQTVIEMTYADLSRYIEGELTDEEMLATSKLTALTR